MDCTIRINGEVISAYIRPEYRSSTLTLWNLETSSLLESQIRDKGPHISLSLSRIEFVYLASSGKWPPEHTKTPDRIFGQITDLAGRSACDYGSTTRYIDNIVFDSSINGKSLAIVIRGTTLPPSLYKSRSTEERALLGRIHFSASITVPMDEMSLFVKDEATLESLTQAIEINRAG